MPGKTVSASEFKARCLALIDEMNRTNAPVIVTKHGKPVAEMRPAHRDKETAKPFLGSMKDEAYRFEDPFSPAVDPTEWEAMR